LIPALRIDNATARHSLFDDVIAPAVAKCGDQVIRVDRLGASGDASSQVAIAITESLSSRTSAQCDV
jgi:hypothetical protein